MSDGGPTESNPDYDDWPVQGRPGVTYVGLLDDGTHVVYDEETDELLSATAESEELVPTGSLLEDAETALGERLEAVGERTGWESISSFAREHLESGEN